MTEPSGRDGLDFELFDEFDPLAADDDVIDQENMDDDNPYDTVDFPTLRNMPASMQRDAAYTPQRQGSIEAAVFALVDYNPARRDVLTAILDMCRDGCAASEVERRVNQIQADNRSVYAPMTLCAMLQRAGALKLDMPEVAEEKEDVAANVEYLEIKETVDPVWYATQEGLAALEKLTSGAEFRDIVLDRDSRYEEVYLAVMEFAADEGRSKKEIENLVDTFDIVKSPRRFGGHFIDMLERTGALAWKSRAWHLTDFGHAMLQEMTKRTVKEG